MCFPFFLKKRLQGFVRTEHKCWERMSVCEGNEQNRSDGHFPFLYIPGRFTVIYFCWLFFSSRAEILFYLQQGLGLR